MTDHELHERYRQAHNPVERSRWQFLWLLARGLPATAIARVTGYSAYWIGQIAHRYNSAGPDGLRDQRHHVLALLASAGVWISANALPRVAALAYLTDPLRQGDALGISPLYEAIASSLCGALLLLIPLTILLRTLSRSRRATS